MDRSAFAKLNGIDNIYSNMPTHISFLFFDRIILKQNLWKRKFKLVNSAGQISCSTNDVYHVLYVHTLHFLISFKKSPELKTLVDAYSSR